MLTYQTPAMQDASPVWHAGPGKLHIVLPGGLVWRRVLRAILREGARLLFAGFAIVPLLTVLLIPVMESAPALIRFRGSVILPFFISMFIYTGLACFICVWRARWIARVGAVSLILRYEDSTLIVKVPEAKAVSQWNRGEIQSIYVSYCGLGFLNESKVRITLERPSGKTDDIVFYALRVGLAEELEAVLRQTLQLPPAVRQ